MKESNSAQKMRIVTIVCWIVAAVALVGLVAWFVLGSTFNFGINLGIDGVSWGFGGGTYEAQTTHRVPIDGVDTLSINWVAGGVSIRPHDGDEIQITEYSRRALRDGERLQLNTSGNTVSIEFRTGRNIGNMPSKNLEVYIPRVLIGDFDRVAVNSVSGRIEINDVNAVTLDAGTVSGRVELRNIAAENLGVDTTSGRIEGFDVSASRANIRSISGRIELIRTQIDNVDTYTTSGRQTLSGTFNDVSSRSVSGRVEVISTSVPDRLNVGTTSGRIDITVPDEGAISVSHSLRSGRFSSDIPVILHGDDVQFRLSSTSGRVTIHALR